MPTTRRPARAGVAARRPSRVVIRAATPADLDAVVSLRLALLREEARNPLFARARRDLPSRVADLTALQLSATGEVTLLALHGADAIGILRATSSRGTRLVHPLRYGFLTSAYVRPAHRRAGVLRRLLEGAEAWCRDQGLTEVRLHCALENVEGNQAWDALGYAPAEVVRRRVLPPRPRRSE
ncbi:MAG: GNAT family N-acetyltransferase [Gemmatimonadaceae bacterium]|nr:GNAT family N-acetyltransferase [Gemmatimonadaceae bacterium]